MSIKGVEKLVEEMSGGREPIKTFGEKMKAELAGVKMIDRIGDIPSDAPVSAPPTAEQAEQEEGEE